MNNNNAVPVVVVGNIAVGGTGKTPLVIWLAMFLIKNGYRPGIVSRGYGGKQLDFPYRVSPKSDVKLTGDEALLLARKTECPVVISPDRLLAVNYLTQNTDCNIIISDDGLQHYKLARQIEIVVVDAERLFGNGLCLPAGPLREPLSRLKTVDYIVMNCSGENENLNHLKMDCPVFSMTLESRQFYNIASPTLWASRDDFLGGPVHAVAGIGNPARFFKSLVSQGLSVLSHEFPDHYCYTENDFKFDDHPNSRIIMTEKDAVKCESFADYRFWCQPVMAVLEDQLGASMLEKLNPINPLNPSRKR